MARRLSVVILLLVLVGAVLYFINKDESASPLSSATSASQTSTLTNRDDDEGTLSPSAISENTQTTEIASNQQPTQMRPRSLRLPKSERTTAQLNIQEAEFLDSSLFVDTNWKIWNGVKAIPKNTGRPGQAVVGELTGFYLVKESASDPSSFSSSEPFVVYDARLGVAGVVTGLFSVVLKEGVSAEVLTQTLGLKVVNSFPDIRTYYVTSPQEPFDLKAVQDLLKTDPSVESAQMEILSRNYEKN
ncbi:MAG: hypothetical protein OM95_05935 [Bdellovibrio sp. ArHS]|uniref:hypothetical protein n=1 Tax=Bdellovibrio sp. ArHS TaxID=1569284 RepID=UPI0005827521|nr:hypothetical protein [Bdellovibrio sp. ArHS]KHD88999.1 MAG: hypothetical protein OM95_05935 [Bdellovibrio sp. ArHS]